MFLQWSCSGIIQIRCCSGSCRQLRGRDCLVNLEFHDLGIGFGFNQREQSEIVDKKSNGLVGPATLLSRCMSNTLKEDPPERLSSCMGPVFWHAAHQKALRLINGVHHMRLLVPPLPLDPGIPASTA